jgi:hypothetical protein
MPLASGLALCSIMPLASGLALCSIMPLASGLAGAVDGLAPGVQPIASPASSAAAAKRAVGVFLLRTLVVFMGSLLGGLPIEERVGRADDSAMTIR